MSKLPGYSKQLYRDHGPDYRDGKDMEDPKSTLYGLQGKTDDLPIPNLDETLSLYLHSVIPLVSPQEFAKTQQIVERFKNGIGRTLHERLIKRKAEFADSSWFIKWWNEWAYLGYRDSIVHNVTYYLQFADESPHAMDQVRRAARIAHYSTKFRKEVMNGSLKPDMKKETAPRCNTQWKFVFNTCRIPEKPLDFSRTYAGDVYKHVIVARKNRFFAFDVADSAGNALGINEIEAQLRRIVSFADSVGTDTLPVGILTADDRDIWTDNRKKLLSGSLREINSKSLELLESAIFMICLDDTSPVTREEVGKNLLHSNGQNRFWDKSFQIVVFANGRAGYVGEHSMTDGLTTTRFVNEVLDDLFQDSDEVKLPRETVAPFNGNSPLPEPKQLKFALNDELKKEISAAINRFDTLVGDKELKVLMFHGFGKNTVKNYKCSPDAFAQVAFQLAYYKTFGYCKGTYESTQTRDFRHGRTEVTRSCSVDSLNFARKIVDEPNEASKLSPLYEKEAYQLMMKALSAHSAYIGKASQALGCDRHLLGLKFLLLPGEEDAFFKDVAYTRSNHWAISTSGLVGERMEGWGFGEVVPDGIGIGYSVMNNRMRFTVTSRHQWAERFLANLEYSLLEMQNLAEKFTPKSVPKSKL